MPSWVVSLIIALLGAAPQLLAVLGVVTPEHASGVTAALAPVVAGAAAGAFHASARSK